MHQLRVALRRLRSALRLFREALPPGEDAAFAEDLRWAAGVLGRCRDWDVFVTGTLPPLVAAHGDAAAGKALLARARAHQREARRAAREAIVSPRYGLAMIRLARWVSAPAEPAEGMEPLADFASGRLRKGARRVAAGSASFATLDAAARHLLRILVKRQHYAVEFLGSLFKARPARQLGPDVPMHFTAFHPSWKMLDRPSTPPETLMRARSIAMGNGVRYAFTGNIHDRKGQSTYCHQCGQLLISRDWFELSEWNLTAEGNCTNCGTHCAGVFEKGHGDWGGKRQPVRLSDFPVITSR